MVVFQNLSRLFIPSDKELIDVIVGKVVESINDLYLNVSELVNEEESVGTVSSIGFGLSLAIDEALKNGIDHGNKNDINKHIQLEYYIDPKKIRIKVADEGGGFNYKRVSTNTIDPESESGRGLLLIKNFMDEVSWNLIGNEITMVKYRKTAGSRGEMR